MFAKSGAEPRFSRSEESVIELSLMMSRRQFEALEQRARTEAMSVAQFLRRLVHDAVENELPVGLPG